MKKRLTILIVVDILLLVFIFLPSYRKYRRMVTGIKDMETKEESLSKEIKDINKSEKKLKLEFVKLKGFKSSSLFQGDSGRVFLRSKINDAFSRAGVPFPGMNFSQPSSTAGSVYKVNISLSGIRTQYLKLRRLIYYLENSKNLIIIKNISISREKGGSISANINLEAYFSET